MENNFSPKNTHDENIKKSIDLILGQNTVLKKGRKSADDAKRDLFTRVIDSIIAAEERSIIMSEMYHLDLSTYNEVFLLTIENLLSFTFNPDQIKIINI